MQSRKQSQFRRAPHAERASVPWRWRAFRQKGLGLALATAGVLNVDVGAHS